MNETKKKNENEIKSNFDLSIAIQKTPYFYSNENGCSVNSHETNWFMSETRKAKLKSFHLDGTKKKKREMKFRWNSRSSINEVTSYSHKQIDAERNEMRIALGRDKRN